MKQLLQEIRRCNICEEYLPLGPRPIIEATENSKIILISQAPGRIVHNSGKAWADQSGNKLREWLGVSEAQFYDTSNFAIIPMGFCYPGKGKTGDLPPRKECAPTWHPKILTELENVCLTLLIGSYATKYYFPEDSRNLTQKVENYQDYLPNYWPLPHPSPVNRFWRAKNPWFEEDMVGLLRQKIATILT